MAFTRSKILLPTDESDTHSFPFPQYCDYVDDRVVIEEYFYNKGNVCYPHFLICLEIETMSQCH